MIHKAQPAFTMPSRKYLSTKLLPEKTAQLHSRISDRLKNVYSICLTVDIWSSRGMRAYIGITAHYILDYNARITHKARNEKSLSVHQPLLDHIWGESEKRQFTPKRDLAPEPNRGGFFGKIRARFFSSYQSACFLLCLLCCCRVHVANPRGFWLVFHTLHNMSSGFVVVRVSIDHTFYHLSSLYILYTKYHPHTMPILCHYVGQGLWQSFSVRVRLCSLNQYPFGVVMWHATSWLIFISRAISRFMCSRNLAASFSQVRAISRFSLYV